MAPTNQWVCENWRRAVANLVPALGALAILTAPGLDAQIASRTDQVLARRTDKQARLWPERTSGIVKRANGYFERGFLESADMKKGANGLQFVLGGMRSGNGTTFGLGYRRIDLFNERLAFRTTVRGTPQQAYMFDLDLESPRLRRRRGDFRFYIKHENSPKMNYSGAGRILLAQMPPEDVRRLADRLRGQFDAVISASEEAHATRDTLRLDRNVAPDTRAPIVLTPASYFIRSAPTALQVTIQEARLDLTSTTSSTDSQGIQ